VKYIKNTFEIVNYVFIYKDLEFPYIFWRIRCLNIC